MIVGQDFPDTLYCIISYSFSNLAIQGVKGLMMERVASHEFSSGFTYTHNVRVADPDPYNKTRSDPDLYLERSDPEFKNDVSRKVLDLRF